MNEGKEVIAVCKQCNVGVVFLTVCLFLTSLIACLSFLPLKGVLTVKLQPLGKPLWGEEHTNRNVLINNPSSNFLNTIIINSLAFYCLCLTPMAECFV